MYDATIGRWTSEDPIGFAAGDANLYRYVHNGPTNATDPSGLAERLRDTVTYKTAGGVEKKATILVNTNDTKKYQISFQVYVPKGQELGADVKILQFARVSVWKNGKEIVHKKGDPFNGDTGYVEQSRLWGHYYGDPFPIDTKSKDKQAPFVNLQKSTKQGMIFVDIPGLTPPSAVKYDEFKGSFETYVVIDGKIAFGVQWEIRQTVVDGKWESKYIETVKALPIDKLPAHVTAGKYLGGRLYDMKEKKLTGEDFYYDNVLKK
jgi:hypothetical protein